MTGQQGESFEDKNEMSMNMLQNENYHVDYSQEFEDY